MRFYDILQNNPNAIKQMIRSTTNRKEKRKLRLGMIVRSILIVIFAILFIAPLSNIFGSENSAMAVSVFCILLGVRFVDFGYCIEDALFNLAIVFFLLLISPVISYYVPAIFGLIINFVSIFIILLITCDNPDMGNGGLFSFAYIFLAGNPVSGSVFYDRFLMMCVGLVVCGTIFYFKHKHKHIGIRFHDKLQEFTLYSHKHQWQIRLALGVSLILFFGVIFDIEKFMWAGFACGSLLSDHREKSNLHEKFYQRFIGVILGCILFYMIYTTLPLSMHWLIGPFGGFLLGFCTEYKYKTALNCLGALLLVAGIYGIGNTILLRIAHTLAGILFAVCFYELYDLIMHKKFLAS